MYPREPSPKRVLGKNVADGVQSGALSADEIQTYGKSWELASLGEAEERAAVIALVRKRDYTAAVMHFDAAVEAYEGCGKQSDATRVRWHSAAVGNLGREPVAHCAVGLLARDADADVRDPRAAEWHFRRAASLFAAQGDQDAAARLSELAAATDPDTTSDSKPDTECVGSKTDRCYIQPNVDLAPPKGGRQQTEPC